MQLWALLPVKPLAQAKSRLAGVLPVEERASLSRLFLEHMLTVLGETAAVTARLVISRDPAVLAVARAFGAETWLETEPADLNQALESGTALAARQGADAVLVLPTDLPCLTESEVSQLVAVADVDPMLVIAPDRHEAGTNALVLRPPRRLPYAFGEGSFQRHCRLAEQSGWPWRVCRLPGLALDVDVPEDLAEYQAYQSQESMY